MFFSVNWHDLKGAENGKHTVIILIDFQKDFDTLDHKILSEKNQYIIFLGKNKMISFLSDKQSFSHFYFQKQES